MKIFQPLWLQMSKFQKLAYSRLFGKARSSGTSDRNSKGTTNGLFANQHGNIQQIKSCDSIMACEVRLRDGEKQLRGTRACRQNLEAVVARLIFRVEHMFGCCSRKVLHPAVGTFFRGVSLAGKVDLPFRFENIMTTCEVNIRGKLFCT